MADHLFKVWYKYLETGVDFYVKHLLIINHFY